MTRRQLAQRADELVAGSDEVHVADDRFEDDRRDVAALLGERRLEAGNVVVVEHERVLRGVRRDTCGTGLTERQRPRTGLHEQCIRVTVIAALELHDDVPAGVAARQTDRGHRRLGPGTHEPHHLDGRQQARQQFGHLEFALGRRAERKAVCGGFLDGPDDVRMRVPGDHRPPRSDVVDVRPAVGIPEPRTATALEESGSAADGTEGPDRRVHAPGNDSLGACEQFFIA